jgi:hypothetical protein
MPRVIEAPVRIEAQGEPPKTIEEFIGLVSSKTETASIARIVSPPGWSEPGQAPEFGEFTVALSGCLQVESGDGIRRIEAGQAVMVSRNEWVRYSTPRGRSVHRRVFARFFSFESSPRCAWNADIETK